VGIFRPGRRSALRDGREVLRHIQMCDL